MKPKPEESIQLTCVIRGKVYKSPQMPIPAFMSDGSAIQWAFAGLMDDFNSKQFRRKDERHHKE